MNVLGTVLPGVRALRAPFAAGSILMLAAWIAFAEALRRSGTATDIYDSLRDLRPVLRGVGATAVIAFAAYLVGSLSAAFTQFVSLRAGLRRGWLVVRASGWGDRDATALLSELGKVGGADPRLMHWHKRKAALYGAESKGMWRNYPRYTQQEWRLVLLRVLRRHPTLYTEIDRLESEGEFRRAIAGPVLALGLAVASRTSWPAIALIAIVSAVLSYWLLLAARQATVEAEQAVADLVVDRHVTLPFIAELRAASGLPSEEPADGEGGSSAPGTAPTT